MGATNTIEYSNASRYVIVFVNNFLLVHIVTRSPVNQNIYSWNGIRVNCRNCVTQKYLYYWVFRIVTISNGFGDKRT